MLVVMQAAATEQQVRAVCERIEALGHEGRIRFPGRCARRLELQGIRGYPDLGVLEAMPE